MVKFNECYYPFFKGFNLINKKLYKLKNSKNFFNIISINQSDVKFGKEKLKELGIDLENKKNWFVVLHIRETKDTCTFRNANPESYLKSIRRIIKLGGKVVRVGDKNWLGTSIKPLPKIEGLIDYTHSKIKSDFMDIFLAAKCKFCIGTSSGYWTVPMFFDKPILFTNYLPVIDYFSFRKKDIFLPKTLINKKTNKLEKLENIFNLPLGWFGEDKFYEGYKIVNNSEEELYEATEEMLIKLKLTKNNNFLNKNEVKLKKKLSAIHNNKLTSFAQISKSFIRKYN